MTEEDVFKTFELAGFATSHILTTLHSFTTFTPLVVTFGEYGKKMIRVTSAGIKDDMSDVIPGGTIGYAFLAPVKMDLGTPPKVTNAIGIKVFSKEKEGLLALPFIPRKLFSKFKVGNIKFLGIPEGMTDRVDDLLRSYIDGSQGHVEGTKIWDAAAENF